MMLAMATADHKANLTYAAIALFRRQGFSATGLKQILDESQTPRGSLYHYFPGGKDELGAHAITVAGAIVAETLTGLARESVSFADFLSRYLYMLASWLEESDYRDGCPIATSLLERASDCELMREAGERVLVEWTSIIAGVLVREGEADAQRRAAGVLAAAEGALLLSRVHRSTAPLLELPSVLR
jgi:TetR/AcrR family transcriptional repressor of lmrAB and yxaGH operons